MPVSTIKHPLSSAALLMTLVAASLVAPGKAQAYPVFNLSDIWPDVGTPVTSVTSVVPGTSIPIAVTTSQPIARNSAGLLIWQSGAPAFGLETNDWTITVGAPSKDLEVTLRDFDRFTVPNAPGGVALETMTQVNTTLGAPTSLTTTGAPDNAQMIYEAGVDGGRIIQNTIFPGNVVAGTTVALWEGVNLSTITFTTTRNDATLGQGINVRLGEVTPQATPEPSSWALMLTSVAALGGFARLRLKSASFQR